MKPVLMSLTLALGTAGPVKEETAEEAFERLQSAAERPDSDEFRVFLTEKALAYAGDVSIDEKCRELAAVLTGWKTSKIRVEDGEAAAAMKDGREVREVLLRLEEGKWKLASASSYLVEGADLRKRSGKKPATVELKMRDSNGAYAESAFCFTYVTASGEECKNRMDVWLCHNQDLHGSKDAVLVDVGKRSLRSIDRIPLDVSFEPTVRAEPGHTYVIHCRDRRDRDFYVKLRIKALKRGEATLEWSLLSTGRGAPETIHKAQPLRSNDGADAVDGLCRKTG